MLLNLFHFALTAACAPVGQSVLAQRRKYVTDTQDTTTDAPVAKAAKKRGGINTMLLADLKSMAGGLGISGAGSMKKAQLIDAIKAHQASQSSGGGRPARQDEPQQERQQDREPRQDREPQQERQQDREPRQERQQDREPRQEREPRQRSRQREERTSDDHKSDDKSSDDGSAEDRSTGNQNQGRQQNQQRNQNRQGGQGGQGQGNQQRNQTQQSKQNQQDRHDDQSDADPDEDGEGGRRNRRRRGRDRDRTRAGGRNEPDTTILEDDVLVPAAGILDVLDNYAFVRTSGYLPGADDVYLSLSMVRKYGLRRGDAIVGQVRQPREGERKEKFNPMVRIDSVNGADPESAKQPARLQPPDAGPPAASGCGWRPARTT